MPTRRSGLVAPVVVLVLGSLLTSVGCGGEPTRVMSFNVLCSVCDTANYDPWEARLEAFRDVFARHEPDLIGLQEVVTYDELEQIDDLLPEHAVLRAGADTGGAPTLSYPDSSIYYRTERYAVVDAGTFWLSQRPDTSPYPSWDLSLPRNVIWAVFHDRMLGREVVFMNTHVDNNGPNKVPSAELILERAALGADRPIVLSGDFNSKPDSPSYAVLVGEARSSFAFANTFDLAEAPRIDSNTGRDEPYGCGGLVPDDFPDCRIDHVFVAGAADFTVSDWVSDTSEYGPVPRFPSDHRPIQAEIEIR